MVRSHGHFHERNGRTDDSALTLATENQHTKTNLRYAAHLRQQRGRLAEHLKTGMMNEESGSEKLAYPGSLQRWRIFSVARKRRVVIVAAR
jgi:hypothetical protein